jgi:hypothetical protein
VIGVTWKYIAASLAAGGAGFFLVRAVPAWLAASGPLWAFARLTTVSTLFLAFYLGAVIALHRGLSPLYQVAKLLREMSARGKTPGSTSDVEREVIAASEKSQRDILAAVQAASASLKESEVSI